MAEILPRHKRFVLWGLTDNLDSFRHIHRHYQHALARLGKPVAWLPDIGTSRELLGAGDLVFAVDVAAHHLGNPVSGVDYLLHNIDASHPVLDGLAPERLVRLQVYTSNADQYGVEWAPARRYDREQRLLFQPWGTDLLADEFLPPVFNAHAKHAVFVGSIWDDNGLGNIQAINELKSALSNHRLTFAHHVHVTDEENVALVRGSRIAPAVAGQWQCDHAYLPCRVFKNVSYGSLAVTNVEKFTDLFGDALPTGTVHEAVDAALALSEDDYLERAAAQQEVVGRYTYRESLEAIGRAFEEGR